MPAKLFLQLRLLNPSLPITCLPPSMKLGPRLSLSSSSVSFSRLFPHRLKHQSLGLRRRCFSTGASKSLVDDEAELSAWVSDISRGGRRLADDGPDRDSGGRNVRPRVTDNRGSRDFSSEKRTRPGETYSDDSHRSHGPRTGSRESPRSKQFDSKKSSRFQEEGRSLNRRDNDNGYGESRKRSPRFQEEGSSSSRNRQFDSTNRDGKPSDSRTSNRFEPKRGVGRGELSTRKSGPRFQDGRQGGLDSRKKTPLFSEDEIEGFSLKMGGESGEFSTRKSGSRFPDGRNDGLDSRKKAALFTEDEDEDDDEDEDEDEIEGFDLKMGDESEKFLTRKIGSRFQDDKKGRLDLRKKADLFTEDEDEHEDEDGDDKIEGSKKFSIGDLLSEDESDAGEEDEEGDVFGDTVSVGSTKVSGRVTTVESDSYLSDTRFDQCKISPLSLKGIKDVGYERLTIVQAATLPIILKGKDVLAKAKTGTGKTVAFLLPSIEVVLNSPPTERDQKRPPIIVLVICPTRELACQAAAEANTLLKYHPSIGVQVVIGGTRIALEQKRIQANPCQILVATPGRLKDHLENTPGFLTKMNGVKVLVLDEADHLLDMGFRKDIERIIEAVPKQRQTLLFSATVPNEVRQVCHIALKRDHEFINTVQGGSEDTHSQVKQMYMIAPLDKQFSLLYALLKEHIANDVEYKVIVFCTTAMLTKLVAELLGELKMNVREIHSRKSQSYRTKVSDEFRKSKGLILATSDVSARGVDYPDVTLVIQVGLPADKQQYIHRLGRTGRKGKEGEGVLLLSPWEEFFLSYIKDLPIAKAEELSADPNTKKTVQRALSHIQEKSKESAYQAWLGYYNSNKIIGRDKSKLVELANEFSRSMGLDTPPAIPKLVLGKMGLKNVPGLRAK